MGGLPLCHGGESGVVPAASDCEVLVTSLPERVDPAPEDGADIAHVIAPPLLYLGPLLLGLTVDQWWPWGALTAPWRWIPGVICIGLTGLLIAAILAFRRARTRPEPWKPTTALVVDGPYRRNELRATCRASTDCRGALLPLSRSAVLCPSAGLPR